MHLLLVLGISIAMAAGFWNMRAAMRAGRGADWRANRDGLRAPGSSQSFTFLSLIGPALIIGMAAIGVPLLTLMMAGLAYAIAFVALSVRERRRSETYYRGNVGITS